MKTKTYVLTVSRDFPATHPLNGFHTCFPEKILTALGKDKGWNLLPKIHTIRANYELWKKRIDEVNEGKAVLSLRYWTGKPYNSKQEEFVRLDKDSGICVQKIEFDDKLYTCLIDDKRIDFEPIPRNDGLAHDDFESWFKGYDSSNPMAIIQFTSFRY